MPDSREFALLIWLVPVLWWILSNKDLRSGLGDIFRTFLHPQIFLPLLATFGYIGLEVWAAARLGVWNRDLLKPTILWAVLTASVMFFESIKAAKDPQFFRTVLAETIAVGPSFSSSS
jgi:hypothetical protein